MNGNNKGAQEVYHLAGASPSSTYQVVIVFYTNDTTCSTTPASVPTATLTLVPTATLTTNQGGNGNASFDFPASPPSPPQFDSAIWELKDSSGAVDYATACNEVTIGGAK